ncbi:outer membrane beta-barrel protein [Alkalimonas collagenimarina]|uniref:Outer membrane beta-barrel protein n=1 Tax=Alkalimonas collagenimarina TaxID=400390 RepID=A0ABT9GXW6_9GAMM|nr:outer membrane beta-barrel protein [Alkalimonas collagenimarina]MDP4535704.1 outer membrane beta-barrel protein [Alkalimonas collagenimarina]
MQFKLTLCAALVAATSAVADSNSDINWNYVSAGYAKANIKLDAADFGERNRFKPDGWQLQGSYLLTERLYLRGRYDRVTGDLLNVSAKSEQSWLSLGLRQQIMPGLDTFFEGGYAKESASSDILFMDDIALRYRDSGSGYQLGAGVRYMATPELELGAALRHINVSGLDSSTLGELNASFRLNTQFAIYGNFLFESDNSLLGVGISYHF